jgi:uncharacterized repeat protein (TIGR01451 family)
MEEDSMRIPRTFGFLSAACAIVALMGHASPRALASVSLADISSAGPLTNIQIGVDLSCQVAHAGDTDLEFYPPSVTPGDCGTVVSVNGTVYSPDFNNHDITATDSLSGVSVPFTPVSQTGVTGSGTAGDPFQVITVADAGDSGLRITETDTYVVGQESYRTDLQVQNVGNTSLSAIIYRAGDCYLGGSDEGYGLAVPATKTVACSVNANNSPAGRIEQWSPITPADHYLEANFDDVWAALATGNNLPDSCICGLLDDNGAAINWDRTIPAGGSVTLSHLTTFSPVGTLPLVVTKTADDGAADPGAQDGYTISISNPNVDDIDVSDITDTLPAGFSYVSGSTTGATTADPTVASQTLTWTGPFTIPGDSSPPLTLHFNVTVSDTPDTYYNSADVGGADAVPADNVAPITVGGEGTPTSTSTATFTPTATATAECGTATPTATNTAVATKTVFVTSTAEATHTAETTRTAQATHTAEVTSTAEATNTETIFATGVNSTAQATHTAEVTHTAEATHTAETTSTARSTRTAQVTRSPEATESPAATDTTVPTATSTSSPTPTATACVTPSVHISTATPTPTTEIESTSTSVATASSTPTGVSGVLGEQLPPGVTSGVSAGPSALPNSGDGTMRRNVSVLLSVAALLAGFGGLFAVVAYQRRRNS